MFFHNFFNKVAILPQPEMGLEEEEAEETTPTVTRRNPALAGDGFRNRAILNMWRTTQCRNPALAGDGFRKL